MILFFVIILKQLSSIYLLCLLLTPSGREEIEETLRNPAVQWTVTDRQCNSEPTAALISRLTDTVQQQPDQQWWHWQSKTGSAWWPQGQSANIYSPKQGLLPLSLWSRTQSPGTAVTTQRTQESWPKTVTIRHGLVLFKKKKLSTETM